MLFGWQGIGFHGISDTFKWLIKAVELTLNLGTYQIIQSTCPHTSVITEKRLTLKVKNVNSAIEVGT